MTESMAVALITGLLTLAGVIFSNVMSNNKIQAQLEKAQAVTEERIDNLTQEVKKHNTFDRRITELETTVKFLEKGVAS